MSDKISILIAEDESIYRKIITENFLDTQFRGVFVWSIEGALHKLTEGLVPEVAVIDWNVAIIDSEKGLRNLPEISYGPPGSIDLAKYIQKETNNRCRIIITTGVGGVRSEMENAGIWGVFYKMNPPDWKLLREEAKRGFLRDDEIGKSPINLMHEFYRRSVERG